MHETTRSTSFDHPTAVVGPWAARETPTVPTPLPEPQASETRPRRLTARVRLFFYRTTLGPTRQDGRDV
jgi:hypothetical protein